MCKAVLPPLPAASTSTPSARCFAMVSISPICVALCKAFRGSAGICIFHEVARDTLEAISLISARSLAFSARAFSSSGPAFLCNVKVDVQ